MAFITIKKFIILILLINNYYNIVRTGYKLDYLKKKTTLVYIEKKYIWKKV